MRIVAIKIYSRKVQRLLTEDERQTAEDEIATDPLRWPVVAGTGGVRKARAARGSSGKRGGVRIIYYYLADPETLYLLTAYAKGRKDDLTPDDKTALRKLVKSL